MTSAMMAAQARGTSCLLPYPSHLVATVKTLPGYKHQRIFKDPAHQIMEFQSDVRRSQYCTMCSKKTSPWKCCNGRVIPMT